MKKSIKNVLIGFILCICVTVGIGSQLSFDNFNVNLVGLFTFIIAFSYIIYFLIFGIVIYHKEISRHTIQKIQHKIEKLLNFQTRNEVHKLGLLASLIDFLALSIISTHSPDTVSSILPGNELLKPLFDIILKPIGIQETPIPYISSLKYLMLSIMGPAVVFILRFTNYLKQETKKNQANKDKESQKFLDINFLIFFLLISPVVLIITRITTSDPIEFDLTLLSISMLSIIGWIYVWFMQLFESILFSKLKR